ncbi:hypothetical protein KQI52_07265 [bacterium]|nr:hypothetical protein [bacterium]
MRKLLVILLPFLLLSCATGESGPWNERDNSKQAYEQSQQFVLDQLIDPDSAVFPSMRWNDKVLISRDGESQRYIVEAYVETTDAFGEKLHLEYVADLEQVRKGDWVLLSLRLDD